jgi:hypothetical protein
MEGGGEKEEEIGGRKGGVEQEDMEIKRRKRR